MHRFKMTYYSLYRAHQWILCHSGGPIVVYEPISVSVEEWKGDEIGGVDLRTVGFCFLCRSASVTFNVTWNSRAASASTYVFSPIVVFLRTKPVSAS